MKYFLLIVFLLTSLKLKAESGPIDLQGKKLGNIPIRVLGSFKLQRGTFGSGDDTTFAKRDMTGFGADVMAGLKLGPLMVGAGGEYLYWVEASENAGDSLQGFARNFFIAAGLTLGDVFLLGKYYFNAKYGLAHKVTSGEELNFIGSNQNFSLSLLIRLGKRNYISFDAASSSYDEEERDNVESSLTTGETMKLTSFGISFGFIY
ncbi:MAG: hypothetical protein JNM93_01730 [Bacteriovoracaceae bacterium]|nr:hypothetical protein [Bacteriovoracaceae bacterium]